MTFELRDIEAGYGRSPVVQGISLTIEPGQILALLGANGAGKTTVLRAISGVVSRSGSVTLDERELISASPREIVRAGIAHVPQGRGTFGGLTVSENLQVAQSGPATRFQAIEEEVCTLFPILKERWNQPAGELSGGEQQMLAVARAMMLEPRYLLLDEPSLGLAPIIRTELFDTIAEIARRGIGILLVEQNADLSFRIAHAACLLSHGRIVASGTAEELARSNQVGEAYLGHAG